MVITAVEAQRDLEDLIEQVNLEQSVVEIVSERGVAVLMSKKEYDALAETGYLLSSPANARRLLSSLNSVRPRENCVAPGDKTV